MQLGAASNQASGARGAAIKAFLNVAHIGCVAVGSVDRGGCDSASAHIATGVAVGWVVGRSIPIAIVTRWSEVIAGPIQLLVVSMPPQQTIIRATRGATE